MRKTKLFISLLLAVSVLMVQVASVLAAPASISIRGTVQSITLETNSNTGTITVLVGTVDKNQALQTVRISQETAITLGLVMLDGDGTPVINELALGQTVEIDPGTVIPDQEADRHPVGNALTTFFSDVQGLNYDTIMAAHHEGVGFGVIAQALWLTVKLEGNSDTFQDLLAAKKTGDYSKFKFGDGTIPKNWGQLRKAILDGDKKNGLGPIMSNNHGNGKDKDKDKNNNGNGGGNGNGNNK